METADVGLCARGYCAHSSDLHPHGGPCTNHWCSCEAYVPMSQALLKARVRAMRLSAAAVATSVEAK